MCLKLFNKIFTDGTSKDSAYLKHFYIPKFAKSDWIAARSICQSYGLEFATFSSLTEVNSLKYLDGKDYILIGGTTSTGKSLSDWYWVTTGEKINFEIPWYPGEPSFSSENENCMNLIKSGSNEYKFNDAPCDDARLPFICEKIEWSQ